MKERYLPYVMLALAAVLLFAATQLYAAESTVERNAGDVTLVQCEAGSRAIVSRVPPSIGRVVCGPLPSFPSPAPSPTSPATASSTAVPTATGTPTPSAVPTATSTPTATTILTTGTPTPICGAECGQPRNFCDTWTGGWCNDYRSVGDTAFEVGFDTAAQGVSFDCLDATDPGYEPQMLGGTLPFPCIFTKHEHFMTRMESGSFGIAMMRFHRPVDLTSERHIHLESDLKPQNTRNYFRVMLSPDLTKRDPDDRGGDVFPRSFVQAWFRNGKVEGSVCRNGVCDGDNYPWGDAFGSVWPPMPMADNVRVPIDIYLSQTSIKVYISGELKVSDTFAPLGFDLAYLYLSQASYSPTKDGNVGFAPQIAHWDSVAVDGPTLGVNALTPRGYRDYVWNTYAATACSIGGFAAQSSGPAEQYTWLTWVSRVPESLTLTAADISCSAGAGYNLAPQQHQGFEVVSP